MDDNKSTYRDRGLQEETGSVNMDLAAQYKISRHTHKKRIVTTACKLTRYKAEAETEGKFRLESTSFMQVILSL